MDGVKVTAEGLKYVSIVVGSVSGIVGAIYATKDKDGKPNTAAKVIVAVIAASAILGVTSQGFDDHTKQIDQRNADGKAAQLQIKVDKLTRDQVILISNADKLTSKIDGLVTIVQKSWFINASVVSSTNATPAAQAVSQMSLANTPTSALIPENAGASTAGKYALAAAIGELKQRARNIGGNDRGPFVVKYLKVVHLPEGTPWASAFVCWCYSQVPGGMPFVAKPDAPSLLAEFKTRGWAHTLSEGYVPAPGDIMWLTDPNADTKPKGIVMQYANRSVRTIQGNTNSKDEPGIASGLVALKLYHLTDAYVFGHVPDRSAVAPHG
jgi:hypothetical protein